MRPLDVRRLGRISYANALALQRTLVDERKAGRIPDTLLLLEHPHIVASPERLAGLGVEVFEAGRGGDVTYHGPGQIVGYPILDLRPDRQDVHRYVRDLEEVMIRVAADFGVAATRIRGLTGIWVGPEGAETKLAAIGIRISRWVTSHGFAFNVNTDLDFFRLIVPCGIADRGVASLEQLIGQPQDIGAVEARFVHHMGSVFDRDARLIPPCSGSIT